MKRTFGKDRKKYITLKSKTREEETQVDLETNIYEP